MMSLIVERQNIDEKTMSPYERNNLDSKRLREYKLKNLGAGEYVVPITGADDNGDDSKYEEKEKKNKKILPKLFSKKKRSSLRRRASYDEAAMLSQPQNLLNSSTHSSPGTINLKSCLSSTNLNSLDDSSTNRMKRNVSFHQIEIRSYERDIGDNPSVRTGPALSLGWDYNPESTVLPVEDYEQCKPEPRDKSNLLMPKSLRETILKEECGYTRSQIVRATKQINITKRQRRKTANLDPNVEKAMEMFESGSKFVKRAIRPRSKRKQLRPIHNNLDLSEHSDPQLMLENEIFNKDTVETNNIRGSKSMIDLSSLDIDSTLHDGVLKINSSRSCANLQDIVENLENSTLEKAISQSCDNLEKLGISIEFDSKVQEGFNGNELEVKEGSGNLKINSDDKSTSEDGKSDSNYEEENDSNVSESKIDEEDEEDDWMF